MILLDNIEISKGWRERTGYLMMCLIKILQDIIVSNGLSDNIII